MVLHNNRLGKIIFKLGSFTSEWKYLKLKALASILSHILSVLLQTRSSIQLNSILYGRITNEHTQDILDELVQLFAKEAKEK